MSVNRTKQPIQFNSNSRLDFVNKPLSNFDLIEWVKKNLELNISEIFLAETTCQKRLEKNVEQSILTIFKELEHIGFVTAELWCAKRVCGATWVSKSTHPRKFGNHVTVHRPPARPSVPTTGQPMFQSHTFQQVWEHRKTDIAHILHVNVVIN